MINSRYDEGKQVEQLTNKREHINFFDMNKLSPSVQKVFSQRDITNPLKQGKEKFLHIREMTAHRANMPEHKILIEQFKKFKRKLDKETPNIEEDREKGEEIGIIKQTIKEKYASRN